MPVIHPGHAGTVPRLTRHLPACATVKIKLTIKSFHSAIELSYITISHHNPEQSPCTRQNKKQGETVTQYRQCFVTTAELAILL